MKESEPMNWTKRQTQYYGGFLAVLGLLIEIFGTTIVIDVIQCYQIVFLCLE